MIVLPAIDIQNGHAVRLRQGIQDDSTQYFDDPVEAAKQWEAQGAQYLHVVDLDGAFSGSRRNSAIISDICRTVHIPVEVGGVSAAVKQYRRI
jgi:phosphoribosylformimino-5-aminoimidazole carboxamide ribotide isomerase